MIRQRKPIKRKTPLRRCGLKRKRSAVRRGGLVAHVERDSAGICTILGNCHPASCIRIDLEHVPRARAVEDIRQRCYDRSGGRCEHVCKDATAPCGKCITWDQGHLHERVHRGDPKGAGLMSIYNSEFICGDCHENDENAHGKRKVMWSTK